MNRAVVESRFPVKRLRDAASLARVVRLPTLTRQQRRACLRFYFSANGIRNLLASPGRSGAAWTMLGIELALDLAEGGNGDYRYDHDAWMPDGGKRFSRLDWRVPCGTELPTVARPTIFHTQLPYCEIRIAPLADMKTVLVVRSIPEILESMFYKSVLGNFDLNADRNDEDSFDWDGQLSRLIRFHNSWGDAIARNRHAVVFKYHELKQDPVGTHQAMIRLWGFDVPEDCLALAFERNSKATMKSRIPAGIIAANPRVSYRAERGALPRPRFEAIIDRLREELIHDFGYAYDYDHEYGHVYD